MKPQDTLEDPAVAVAIVLGGTLTLPPSRGEIFEHVLFVDGGIHFQNALRLAPPAGVAAWLGDGDSAGPAGVGAWRDLCVAWGRHIDRVDFRTDKDFSDFGGTLDFITERVSTPALSLHVFAGLGGRADHELINLLEARQFAARQPFPVRFTFHPHVSVTNAPLALDLAPGDLFSVIVDSYPAQVVIQGADFSGNLSLERPSHGLSNHAQGPVLLTPLKGCVLTVFIEPLAT